MQLQGEPPVLRLPVVQGEEVARSWPALPGLQELPLLHHPVEPVSHQEVEGEQEDTGQDLDQGLRQDDIDDPGIFALQVMSLQGLVPGRCNVGLNACCTLGAVHK